MPGVVIIDTSCLKQLELPSEREVIARSLATADLELWPTAINALEAAQNPNAEVRRRSLTIVAALAEGRGLLPLPEQMLRAAGQAVIDGADGFWTGPSGLEPILDDPAHLAEVHREGAVKFLRTSEEGLGQLSQAGRRLVQRILRTNGLADAWSSAREFLDQQWLHVDQLDDGISQLWARLGLPGPAPIDALLSSPVWRLFLEAEGLAIYERAVVREQPKRVGHADLLQLLGAVGGPKRVIVTDDGPLRRAASILLESRYPMSRVMSWSEFRACHPV